MGEMTPLYLALTLATLPQTPPERASSLTGNVKHHPSFESKGLKNKRNLIVYLPPDYENSEANYPVIYMHDGQNVMDGNTSYIPNEEWRADETAEGLIRAGMMKPVIIVGIDNAGMDRGNEFLPTKVKRGNEEMGGRADGYIKFLTDEVQPFIEKNYRVAKGAKNTALIGSSFGGIITLWGGLKRPDRFGMLGVMSPSIWWDDKVMLKLVPDLGKKNVKIWMDMGTDEGFRSVADSQAMRDVLVKLGWKSGQDLIYYEDPRAKHNERAWAHRLDMVFRYFFGTQVGAGR